MYWRIPELVLVEDRDEPRLGSLGADILGPDIQAFDRTAWKQRPVLAALGLFLIMRNKISVDQLLDSLRTAGPALPLPGSSYAQALQQRLERLQWTVIAERDAVYLHQMCGGLANPAWRRGITCLDRLIALELFEDAANTLLWKELLSRGLTPEIVDGLRACERIRRSFAAISDSPEDFKALWRDRSSISRLIWDSRQMDALTHKYRVAIYEPNPLRGIRPLRQVWNRAELAELMDLLGDYSSRLPEQMRAGRVTAWYHRQGKGATWFLFEGAPLYGERQTLTKMVAHFRDSSGDPRFRGQAMHEAMLASLFLEQSVMPVRLTDLDRARDRVIKIEFERRGTDYVG